MAQNIYDDAEFFANYSQLPRSARGLEAAPEFAELSALLPPLEGRRVVDLGCGFGYFTRWATEQGAASVRAIDLSDNMLDQARRNVPDPRVTFDRQDLDAVRLDTAAFDVAFSSLVLHYLTDLPTFLQRVHDALTPGGAFVFSCEHPIFTAPRSPAFVDTEDGPIWPLSDYHHEGPRVTDWLAPGVVKQHRTMGSLVTALLDAGFTLTALVDWAPSARHVAEHPEWGPEMHRPMFLLGAALASSS